MKGIVEERAVTLGTHIAESGDTVRETAKKYGKFAGTTGGPGNIAEYAAMGYDFVNVAADVIALANVYNDALSRSREALAKIGK